MKKVFFFDVDGTLLPLNKNEVSAKTKYAITELQNCGHEVFIATGKSIQHAGWVGESLNVKNFIATNGQVMQRNNEIIYENYFETSELNQWAEIAKKNEMLLGFQGTYDSGIFQANQELEVKAKKFFDDVSITYPTKISKVPTEYKVGQMWIVGNLENIDADEEKYHIVSWPHTGADILPQGVNKAKGIKYYIENIDANVETYGFGDGHNDIEMFQYVDNAVAMNNADDLVKSYADEITKSSDEDGIYHYLVKNGFIGAINE